MRNKNKFLVLVALMICCFTLLAYAPICNNVFAEDNLYISVLMNEDDKNFYVSVVYEPTADAMNDNVVNYELTYVVNGIEIQENEQLTLVKNGTTYTVYGKISYTKDNTDYVVRTQKLVLDGTLASGNIAQPQNNEWWMSLIKIVLPIIILIGLIIFLVQFMTRKRKDPMDRVISNVDLIKQDGIKTIDMLRNEKLSKQAKSNRYKAYLRRTKKDVQEMVEKIIPLNIESMGQHNILITKLIELNNVIIAGENVADATSPLKRKEFIGSLHRELDKVKVSANEIKTAQTKQCQNIENTFAQHTLFANANKSSTEYKQYLKDKLYFICNDGSDGDGDDDSDN